MARLHRTNTSAGPPGGKRTTEPKAESLEHLREIEANWRTPVKTGGALHLEWQRDAESPKDDGAMPEQDVLDEIGEALGVPLARDAERQRRRQLEEHINGLSKRRLLPPTLERAAALWQAARAHEVRPHTQRMARIALNRILPAFGSKLLCDIDVTAMKDYQQRRLAQGAQGRTINIELGVLRQITQ